MSESINLNILEADCPPDSPEMVKWMEAYKKWKLADEKTVVIDADNYILVKIEATSE